MRVLLERDWLYYGLMGLLAGLCLMGMAAFFKDLHHNGWWRWFYLFGGGYVLLDLTAIAVELPFWRELLLWMFDTKSPYWNVLWSGFMGLGAVSLGIGIWLLKKRIQIKKPRRE